jgi:anthranilate phosphoribosyltransferase
MMEIRHAIGHVLGGSHLTERQAEAVMGQIMAGSATPAQIGGFLVALRAKGETAEEVTGFARAMRRSAVAVRPRRTPLIDTCGTGGDGAGTFNISTTAAFVVAGAGLAVAKHGNRSVSSRCGSADVLQALGVCLELAPERVAECIDTVGIGFLFAPLLHPAMKHAIGPRREMGVRTVFNILGPLTNPAGAQVQVLGIYERGLTEMMARVLGALGSQAAFVVHGADGLDELSTTGVNTVTELRDGAVRTFTLDPADYGLPRATLADLAGGDAAHNAAVTRAVLAGQPGAARDVVLLNAGAALVAGGVADGLAEGLRLAGRSIDSGAARERLDALVAFTNNGAR